jgi:hypothetical protein
MEVTVYIIEESALLQKNPVSKGDVMPARTSESVSWLSLPPSQFKTAKECNMINICGANYCKL